MPSKAKHIKAAETALGIEPIGLETKVEADLRRRWERYMAPLGLALPAQTPPEDMWYRVQAALNRADDRKQIAKAKRSVWSWRWATLGASALAAGLVGFIVTNQLDKPPVPQSRPVEYVAVVTPEGSKASLIVEVNLETGTAKVRPVGVSVESGKSLQMWRIAPDTAPRSVGLVPPSGITELDLTADPGDTIAISLEPEGGSPSGQPTGPVVYSGALISIPE